MFGVFGMPWNPRSIGRTTVNSEAGIFVNIKVNCQQNLMINYIL